jgi:putative intracellular protease/amidase
MWDMPNNTESIALIEAFNKAGKPIVAVCHGPTALVNVRGKECDYMIRGKHVTGFSNEEEDDVGCSEIVPFLLEDGLKERGAVFSKTDNWAPYVKVDGQLITGQNPASAGPAAEMLLKLLRST